MQGRKSSFPRWADPWPLRFHRWILRLAKPYPPRNVFVLKVDPARAHLAQKDDMQPSFDLPPPPRLAPVAHYLHLTLTVMPSLAQTSKRHWPVRRDHCFQRIVLDTICGGVWYDHIARPAYKHLGPAQATLAVQLCQQIIADTADLTALNQQSLAWRGKHETSRL